MITFFIKAACGASIFVIKFQKSLTPLSTKFNDAAVQLPPTAPLLVVTAIAASLL